MIILYKYTSRSRPENFERGLKSIIDNSDDLTKCVILVSIDVDDEKLPQYMEVIDRYWQQVHIKVKAGVSKSKVDAINRDLNDYKAHWDILVNMSDDMQFTTKGYDTIIRGMFSKYFPDGDGFLHLNDGNQKDNVSTMSIMDRKYYERDGYIYNPEYKSVWCDVEETEVAWMRGRYAYDATQLFTHLHPAWGLAPNDAQYIRSESADLYAHDKHIIDNHRAHNYNITNHVNGFKYKTL